MDWLLNYQEGQESVVTTNKAKSALETLLVNLASRQAKRPGFGVRLFVQGCVLAGCDYAPNKLAGVGLVNAFKFVRDNAFRNDSVRFQKILDSMPRKNKVNIDVIEYEKTLAQSEAVFYYHVVTHQDRGHRPLCDPRMTEVESGVEHSRDHHLPLLSLFQDKSFIGDILSPQSPSRAKSPSLQETGGSRENSSAPSATIPIPNKLPKFFIPFSRKTGPAQNPYAKTHTTKETSRKRQREESRTPLANLDPNAETDKKSPPRHDNVFADFARRPTNIIPDLVDPRFVKRRFPSSLDRSVRTQDVATVGFDYTASNNSPQGPIVEPLPSQSSRDTDGDGPSNYIDISAEAPTFFDLTDSNSMPIPTLDSGIVDEDADGFVIYHEQPTRVSLDGTLDVRQSEGDGDDDDHSDTRLGDDQLRKRQKASFHRDANRSTNLLSTHSVYFPVDSGGLHHTQSSKSEEDGYEIIESPKDSDSPTTRYASVRGLRAGGLQPVRLGNSYRSRPRPATLASGSGPLARAFQTQEKLYSTKATTRAPSLKALSWVRHFPPIPKRADSSARKPGNTEKASLQSFFQKVEKKSSTGFFPQRPPKSTQE